MREEDVRSARRAIQNANTTGVCYDSSKHPYWFTDNNDNGTCDADELVSTNSYKNWTPAMIKAAHNYQISQKEPGAWAHNFDYIAQLLFDSIADLGGSAASLIRP